MRPAPHLSKAGFAPGAPEAHGTAHAPGFRASVLQCCQLIHTSIICQTAPEGPCRTIPRVTPPCRTLLSVVHRQVHCLRYVAPILRHINLVIAVGETGRDGDVELVK